MTDDWDDIVSTLAGDRRAYDRIVTRHHAHVTRQMQRFSWDAGIIEELVQDAFVEVYFCLNKYKRQAPFLHWLSRIATRTGYAYWRQQSRAKRHVAIQDWDDAPFARHSRDSSDVIIIQAERAKMVLDRLLEALGPEERLVLVMQYLEEKSLQDISSLTGWTLPMVKMRGYRARKKLRNMLERWDITEDDIWMK